MQGFWMSLAIIFIILYIWAELEVYVFGPARTEKQIKYLKEEISKLKEIKPKQ